MMLRAKPVLVCCTAVVILALATGCVSEGPDRGDTPPSSTATPSATLDADGGTPPPVVGPDGFAGLVLGMTAEEVSATGDATLLEDAGGLCRTFTLTGDLPSADAGSETDGFVSKQYGLAAAFARPGLSTPEGVGVGSTLAELRTAYPDGTSEPGWFRVPLESGREYEFGTGAEDTVETLSIRLVEQDCFD